MDAQQTMDQMVEIVHSLVVGDRIRAVFANKTFKGDLRGRLAFVLAMCKDGKTLRLSEGDLLTLWAVCDSGRWEGFRTYTFDILGEFDPEYFIQRTIGRELLESIQKV